MKDKEIAGRRIFLKDSMAGAAWQNGRKLKNGN
jgi:hypothetical protein